LSDLLKQLNSWLTLLPGFSPLNIIEVLIIAVILYHILVWIINSRAFTLLKGIGLILAFTLFANFFHLTTILWIIEKISTIAVIMLIVVFQPELRKALEQLGNQFGKGSALMNLFSASEAGSGHTMNEETLKEISKAAFEMSKKLTGALIVIEQNENLDDIIDTGIKIHGLVSSGLLINIFEKNTPLHDGAAIIRGNLVEAATCYLPLSANMSISKSLGTRHRAALGISEASDCFTIVVSEETGVVSVVQKGELTRVADRNSLDIMLKTLIKNEEVRRFGGWWKSRSRTDEEALK